MSRRDAELGGSCSQGAAQRCDATHHQHGCNCTVREFGLCVNLHSGDLVAQWKGVNRLYITQLRGFEGFARAAAGAFGGLRTAARWSAK